jgi:hypothetical protein
MSTESATHDDAQTAKPTGCTKSQDERCDGCPCTPTQVRTACPAAQPAVLRMIRPETANINGMSLELQLLAGE